MRFAIRQLLLLAVGIPVLASAQARPFPGPDVQQIYQRLLPQIEKIPAFDHHAHPGYADDPDVDAMAAPPNASEPFAHARRQSGTGRRGQGIVRISLHRSFS